MAASSLTHQFRPADAASCLLLAIIVTSTTATCAFPLSFARLSPPAAPRVAAASRDRSSCLSPAVLLTWRQTACEVHNVTTADVDARWLCDADDSGRTSDARCLCQLGGQIGSHSLGDYLGSWAGRRLRARARLLNSGRRRGLGALVRYPPDAERVMDGAIAHCSLTCAYSDVGLVDIARKQTSGYPPPPALYGGLPFVSGPPQ